MGPVERSALIFLAIRLTNYADKRISISVMVKAVKRYTEAEARRLLERAVAVAGSQKAFAEAHGFTPQYLTDVLKGRRAMAGAILEALGLTRITEFQCQEKQDGRKS